MAYILLVSIFHERDYAVLAEGYLDVIALVEFGISNALGSMGTALTNEQIRVLKRYTNRVISIYDADRAGCERLRRTLGIFCAKEFRLKWDYSCGQRS